MRNLCCPFDLTNMYNKSKISKLLADSKKSIIEYGNPSKKGRGGMLLTVEDKDATWPTFPFSLVTTTCLASSFFFLRCSFFLNCNDKKIIISQSNLSKKREKEK